MWFSLGSSQYDRCLCSSSGVIVLIFSIMSYVIAYDREAFRTATEASTSCVGEITYTASHLQYNTVGVVLDAPMYVFFI